MGQSYDGVYFFGSVSSDGEDQMNEETDAAFKAAGADELDGWFDARYGIGHYKDYASYSEYSDARDRKVIAEFGCLFETSWVGYIEYSATAFYPKDAHRSEWREARVPDWSPEQIETWRTAMEKLRAVLPGLDEPGLRFGCRVG